MPSSVRRIRRVMSSSRNPITGTDACCALAAPGHAATAPPIKEMNSRRVCVIRSRRRRARAASADFRQAERLCALEIGDEFEFCGGCCTGRSAGLASLDDLVDIDGGVLIAISARLAEYDSRPPSSAKARLPDTAGHAISETSATIGALTRQRRLHDDSVDAFSFQAFSKILRQKPAGSRNITRRLRSRCPWSWALRLGGSVRGRSW